MRTDVVRRIALVVSFFFLMFISKRDRDRDRAGDGQREGDTESKAGSRLRTVSTEPNVGLEPTNHEIMT